MDSCQATKTEKGEKSNIRNKKDSNQIYTESNYKNYGTPICNFPVIEMEIVMKWSSFGKNIKYQNDPKKKLKFDYTNNQGIYEKLIKVSYKNGIFRVWKIRFPWF